jgi:hypothetical protein
VALKSGGKEVGGLNHFSVTVRRVAQSTDVDPHFTMAGYSLTVSSDGHIKIEGQYQSRSFSPGTWDAFEVKRLSTGG